MTKYFTSIFLAILLFNACNETKIAEPKRVLTAKDLQSLVPQAVEGSYKANDSLSGLFDLTLSGHKDYLSLRIDSFYIDDVKYFYVLIDYGNPILNRFAIYDVGTNCYLIDKSLTGKLSFEILHHQDFKFIKIVEEFMSKDTLQIARLSLYEKFDDTFNLVYRSFVQLKTPKYTFNQTISSISLDTIKTQFIIPKKYRARFVGDAFVFNSQKKMYLSSESLFDSLCFKEISEFEIGNR